MFLSVNTDARTITDITLTEEYEKLHRSLPGRNNTSCAATLKLFHASFLPETVRQELHHHLSQHSLA